LPLVVVLVLVKLSPQQGSLRPPHAWQVPARHVLPLAAQYVFVPPNAQQAWFNPPQVVHELPF
jgi:hypothetical protein